MEVSREVAERTRGMIDACGLDTLSIFVRNRRSTGTEGLSYLYHHGVSSEAQHAYRTGRVFEHDPFTDTHTPCERSGSLIRWGDRRLLPLADKAKEYHEFIASYDVEVVGAWVQQVLPGFFLVIGSHCKPGGNRTGHVPIERLAHDSNTIAQLVVSDLFEKVLDRSGGIDVMNHVLHPCQDSAQDAMERLSPREREIARLVGDGKQNKQIAYMVGISEFTVENHLRRIYRKLEVRNRTAMTARLLDRPSLQ